MTVPLGGMKSKLPGHLLLGHTPKGALLCCSFQLGLWPGMALSAVDTVLLRGNAPWTLRHR